MKLLLTSLLTVFLIIARASDPYPRQEALDVQHYVYRIDLNDRTNIIRGEATVEIRFKKSVTAFFLDLTEKNTAGLGMTVTEVRMNDKSMTYTHTGGKLTIAMPTAVNPGEVRSFLIRYSGIPEDGLLIDKNKFGDRTFFADHWPDRGHFWLPCIDHPSDKATVEFIITAPEKYQVVATGIRQEESSLEGARKLTHYVARIPVAMKVVAVGVARFAVVEDYELDHIPQSTWVYAQNRDAGFSDFAVSRKVMEYFHRNIGPYPYEKLAHVQSRTRWGGLENAGNIFYGESAVTGKNEIEGLIAHETAHQWFGNSVTESDWHHVWISEGFATYFAALFLEHAHGPERLRKEMSEDREQVIRYFKTNPRPVVDTTIINIQKVLSTNTYQKAGWALHMLRQYLGDEAFWGGIQAYYNTYRNSNVWTADFQKAMERASGKDLSIFFHQWLFQAGHPRVTVTWSYSQPKGVVNVAIRQEQATPFQFPLEIRLRLPDGSVMDQKLDIKAASEQFTFETSAKPTALELDPGCHLLFEGIVKPL